MVVSISSGFCFKLSGTYTSEDTVSEEAGAFDDAAGLELTASAEDTAAEDVCKEEVLFCWDELSAGTVAQLAKNTMHSNNAKPVFAFFKYIRSTPFRFEKAAFLCAFPLILL